MDFERKNPSTSPFNKTNRIAQLSARSILMDSTFRQGPVVAAEMFLVYSWLVSHLAPVYEVTNGLDLRKCGSKALPTADADPHNPDLGFWLTHPDPKPCFPLPEKDLQYS